VQVGDGNTRGEAAVISVLRCQESGRLRSEVIQLCSCDTIIHAEHDLLCHDDRVDLRWVEAVAELFDACDDLIEGHGLAPAVAFDDLHCSGGLKSDAVCEEVREEC